MSVKRPVLRYHGGKWRLARWVMAHFPEHRIYVEPFAGAASVLLQKPRAYAEVYNDLDGEVVNVFRVLRDPAAAEVLRRSLELTPYSRDEFEAAYELQPNDSIEQARRTIVKSFMGFGSAAIHTRTPRGMRTRASTWRGRSTGIRSSAHRSGTTPAHDWRRYPANLPAFVERLRGVVIENRPAADVIACHDRADTLFYLDPPYVASTRTRGKDSYAHEMSDEDHEALAEQLHAVEGMVVLSGYPSALYDALYSDWMRVECDAVAASQNASQTRREVLWLNAAAAERQARPTLFNPAARVA